MRKKRGVFLVVLLFLILFSLDVFGFTKYDLIDWHGDCEEPGECSSTLRLSDYVTTYTDNYVNDEDCDDEEDSNEVPVDFPHSSAYARAPGCYIHVEETESGNDCAWAAFSTGKIIGYNTARALNLKNNLGLHWDGEDAQEIFTSGKKVMTKSSFSSDELICDQDERWTRCTENFYGETVGWESEVDTETITTTYVCLPTTDGANVWMNVNELDASVDRDSDLVPDVLDCAPDNGRIHGEFACQMEEAEERTCITDAECSDLTEGTCKPNGKCESKVCVTDAATEICGDGTNNDCSEWDGTENYDYTQAEDDCDNNKIACEQNCLASGDTCSWIDSETGNNCCGDDGVTDVGAIIQDGTADEMEDDFVCLNQNEELVGSSAG